MYRTCFNVTDSNVYNNIYFIVYQTIRLLLTETKLLIRKKLGAIFIPKFP